MRKLLLTSAALGALLLSGCAELSPMRSVPSAIESFQGDPAALDRVSDFTEAIEASYAKLYEVGMAESVTSEGDDYVLSYAPGDNFVAGLYNVEFEDVILIEDELYFTVASAYRAINDLATIVTETETGLSINHPEYGDFTVVIENGLVVSGFDNQGTWTGDFVYEPDPKVTKLVAEQLAAEG